MASEALKRAVRKYDKEHTKGFYLKLNLETDSDVIERLDQAATEEGGKQGYIKFLIRQDMKRNG